MSATSKTLKKAILHNPVNEYIKRQAPVSNDSLKALEKLQLLYATTNKQLRETQNQTKKLSRLIGEAKHEKRSCEDLLQLMQQHSAERNNLKDQLNEQAERILSYFNAHTDVGKSHEQVDHIPTVHVHSAQIPDSARLLIKRLSGDHKAWNHYVNSNPAASLYHRAEWKDLISNVFGHECYYMYASDRDKVVGVLPLVRLKSRLFGDFMVSMPYFNAGGAIADSLLTEQALMRAANEQAKKTGCDHIEYRDDIRRDDLTVRDEKVNMILPLPDSDDALWRSFSSKLRSQVRRAQRENTVIKVGSTDCLDDFYTVFAHNMRDLGTPVYGKTFFRAILQNFSKNSSIVIVYLDSKPVSAAFLLGYNNTLEIPWASTIKQVNHLSMNMLLYWEVLKFAIKKKYHYFDFGRSSKDSGTFTFKQQWGAIPKQCYWHYWLKDDSELPSLNPNNPKYSLLISLWKKTPVCITKYIGPSIVKNLP